MWECTPSKPQGSCLRTTLHYFPLSLWLNTWGKQREGRVVQFGVWFCGCRLLWWEAKQREETLWWWQMCAAEVQSAHISEDQEIEPDRRVPMSSMSERILRLTKQGTSWGLTNCSHTWAMGTFPIPTSLYPINMYCCERCGHLPEVSVRVLWCRVAWLCILSSLPTDWLSLSG